MAWAPDYITSAQLKGYLKIDDGADDVFVASWVTTVSRNVDDHCARQFGQTAAVEDREYDTKWDRTLGAYIAEVDDIQDVTSMVVEVADTAVSAATSTTPGYRLWPRNAAQKGKPFERITVPGAGLLTVSVKWGWPAAVPTSMYLQAARLAKRRDCPFGIAGSPSEGNVVQLWARLDPDFITSLKPLRREWWAA